ncbi:MAG: PIG-L family deacetylase [Saprospiraceae bacterium]
MNCKILFSILWFAQFALILHGQSKPSSEILENIKKLNVLGSVLYIAAHPDDENTRLITYLSKDKKFRTAYVSLTRGDGGQNLIGAQLDEFLGVIRTNELLEARKIDGGIQFFTRANDFGYSKNAEETFQIWSKDTLLYDLVRIIRQFQPDVIINRFDHRTSGKTHGHHTASAQLGFDAFQMSGSALYRREELKDLEPIIIPRIFFNTSYFFFGSKEKFDASDKSNLYSLDVGSYYPSIGVSNGEISSQSRSMHKSQGFGINSTRGSQLEYFERIDKAKEHDQSSPFDGLDLTWTRINGGGNVLKLINQVIVEFNINNPSMSIPLLQKAERYISELSPGHWRSIKLNEIKEVILQCAGIYSEAYTDKQIISNDNSIKVNTEFICRNTIKCKLESIKFLPLNLDTTFGKLLEVNVPNIWSKEITLKGISNTSPFWLKYGRGRSYYKFDDVTKISNPTQERELKVEFNILLNDKAYAVSKDIIYKNDDPVLGEIRQPLDVFPSVTIEPLDQSLIVIDKKGASLKLTLKSWAANQAGTVSLNLPAQVKCKPEHISYKFANANESSVLEFQIIPEDLNNQMNEIPVLINNSQAYTHTQIKYSHIPWQNVLTPAMIKISAIDLKIIPKKIAYINGAGDFIDEALRKLNFEVKEINPEDISRLDPNIIQVLIFGIRAWNTRENLPIYQEAIMNYVNRGGKVIFQYNTTSELLLGDFLGVDFKISRDRVTDENSPVRILNPLHPILNQPNKITQADFDHWIQERGLYFPNQYSKDWEEVIAMNDPNEKELNSAILYKKIGKGSIIYTPISWFRELPAAVPGAYRLFANLVSF